MKRLGYLLLWLGTGFDAASQEGPYPFVDEFDKWGYHDSYGELVIGYAYDYAEPFVENLAVVGQKVGRGYKYGLMNSFGSLVCELKYDSLLSFSNGMAAYRRNGRWGYLNADCVEVIRPRYQSVSFFSNGFAAVVNSSHPERYSYIDKNGKTILKRVVSKYQLGEQLPPFLTEDSCLYFIGHNQLCHSCLTGTKKFGREKLNIECSEIDQGPTKFELPMVKCDSLSFIGWLEFDVISIYWNQQRQMFLFDSQRGECGDGVRVSQYSVPFFLSVYENPSYTSQKKFLYPVIINNKLVYVNKDLEIVIQ